MHTHSKREDQAYVVKVMLFLMVFFAMWFGGHALEACFLWLGIVVVAGLQQLRLVIKGLASR